MLDTHVRAMMCAMFRGAVEWARRWASRYRNGLSTVVVFVVAAIAFRWARSDAGFWTIDDAGITYAASLELVDHHSLAAYVEGPPVESYSNPLLFFVVALLRLVGLFNPITTHIHLETVVFATMVTLVWSFARSLTNAVSAAVAAIVFTTFQLVTPATWTWNGSGLENVWLSTGLVALLSQCARTQRGAPVSALGGVLAFLVAITRPEAPIYVAAFYLALFALARPEATSFATHARKVFRALVVTAVLYALFLCWRRIAYGDWLPNTYYAKLAEKRSLATNLREYVIPGILPYFLAGVLAASVLALLLVEKTERAAMCLCVFVAASLALPLVAGADWMGEHRFATPFLTMAHASFCVFAAVCVLRLTTTSPRAWRPAHVLLVLAVLLLSGLVTYERRARDPIALNAVTLPRVAYLEGGQRWEQQMRMGIPNPVVQLPDAGGALLVGAMQILDNGYLADFQMARIGRRYNEPTDLLVLNQYQHEERRPDLMSTNEQFALDRSYLGTRYLPPPGDALFWVRRDHAEATVDANAPLLFDDGSIRVHLSNDTVPVVAPNGLFRCELLVSWTVPIAAIDTWLGGWVEHGDHDEIQFLPSHRREADPPNGTERVALLIRAPDHAGSFPVSLEIARAGRLVSGQPLVLEVTRDESALRRSLDHVVRSATPMQAAQRVAWMREQAVARLGMTEFRSVMKSLDWADKKRSPIAGRLILRLRWNARLATLEDVPGAIRTAELDAIRNLFAACPTTSEPTRVLCLGRTVDELRRLGYLDVLSRVPEVSTELDNAANHLDGWTPTDRYRALVGLTLAEPADISQQRRLLAERLDLARSGELPAL